ncbi:hypothetical protein [Stieleria varia]|uniref:Dynamin family protein n=1 Tax=Stieleria varia TaxID=2528005 RepID=A0A5C6B7X9_9BACT|nr:hypothetical protein [Stieleria varia]TWU07917.1 hypothetical protein Pla52n_04940 [Stieleria varia]
MFGFGRESKKPPIDWLRLLALLEDDDQRAAVVRLFPDEGRESYLTALKRMDPQLAQDVTALGRQVFNSIKLAEYPTLAVAGMLNSGKTSLVASFLSPAGRARTLRGSGNGQGTHRFVLWLPSQWRQDAELWNLLLADFGDAVGHPPELLAETPEAAHAQYNNRIGDESAISVPLVATDDALNELGVGLLDCPDIVSDAAFGLGSPETRRELLGRASTFCSAFLVVSSAQSCRDVTLGDLLRIAADLMPGIPRLLAVNQIRPPQTPDEVLETFGPLAEKHGIDKIFAAYDFDVPASAPFIPKRDTGLTWEMSGEGAGGGGSGGGAADGQAEQLPIFFSLSQNADDNPPAEISDNRLLIHLPAQLDRSNASERFLSGRQQALRRVIWEQGYPAITKNVDESVERTQRARECLLKVATEVFTHTAPGGEIKELRMHQSERILRQLSESFCETAPWYARWGVRVNTFISGKVKGASDVIRRWAPSAIAQRFADEMREKLRRGEVGRLISAEQLSDRISAYGGPMVLSNWFDARGNEKDAKAWHAALGTAIERFEHDDFTVLDPKRLDDAVRQMWKEVPMSKKMVAGLTPLAASLAAFGSVMMLPIDGGATVLAAASIPELFAAAGLTAMAAMWSGGQNTRMIGRQAASQQLADFHAVLCDTLGVARNKQSPDIRVGGAKLTLPQPTAPVKTSANGTIPLYRVGDSFVKELQAMLPR